MDPTKAPEVIEGQEIINHHEDSKDGLNHNSNFLIKTYEGETKRRTERGMSVNPIASELAAWYEKLRTAIENRDEEVILRAAIERILRRRLLLGGNGKSVADSLVRELLWARYFPDESVGEEKINEVEKTIDLYLDLRNLVPKHNRIGAQELNEWIYQLMSADLESKLSSHKKKEAMISYIFHNLKNTIVIVTGNSFQSRCFPVTIPLAD